MALLCFQGAHAKHNPLLLKESVDKSLELLEQGKLKGPHISGEFELNQVYSGKSVLKVIRLI